jgi:YD repeat-containing protein
VYDDLNRLTSRTYNDDTPNVTYTYDASGDYSKGRLTSVNSSISEYSFAEYDPLGRVKTSTQTTDGQLYSMKYEYNASGAMVSQEYPSGKIIETTVDSAGRIAGVGRRVNPTTLNYYAGGTATDTVNRFQYSAFGGVEAMKFGNGLWEHTTINSRAQVTQIGLGHLIRAN